MSDILDLCARLARPLPRAALHYSGLVAAQIRRSLLEGQKIPEANGLVVDQLQSNGCYGVKQLRVTLPEGMGTYRVIVAPADAPVFIGKVHADQHFLEPLIPTKPETA
jgi:hypothetical protein